MKQILQKAYLFIIFIMISGYITVSAQNEKGEYEYWFVVPDAADDHDYQPVFFMVVAGDRATTVTIDMPENPNFTKQTVNLAPKGYHQFIYGDHVNNPSGFQEEMRQLENTIDNSCVITKKGVLITASDPISTYYQLDGYKVGQKEIFSLKGEKALGTEFYTPFQTRYLLSTGYNGQAYRQIQIVAADDNTKVYFKAPTAIHNIGNATPEANGYHSMILNRGETLLLRENERNIGDGLMGTHIYTNGGRIAITTYEDCVTSQGSDPIGDQIVPVNCVGRSYIVIKGFTRYSSTDGDGRHHTHDHVYFLATEDGTKVYEITANNNKTLLGTINKGEHLRLDIGPGTTDPQHKAYETSEPAYCFHQSAVGGELGGALIPSMYSIASREITFYNANGNTANSVFLVYRKGAENSFKIKNGASSIEPFSVNQNETGIEGWLYSKQTLPGPEGVCTISNDNGAFAMGYFMSPGAGGTALYGYLSAFGTFSLGDDVYHCGTSYTLDGGYAVSYKWNGPGIVDLNVSQLTVTKSGRYSVTVDQEHEQITDDVYVRLQNFNGEYIFPSTAIINEELNFSVKIDTTEKDEDEGIYPNVYNAEFIWEFEDGPSHKITGKTSADKIEIPNVSWSTEGRKKITLTIKNLDANCETIIEKYIVVHNYPDNISDDLTCVREADATKWAIAEVLPINTVDKIHNYGPLVVGDIDGDGKVEIIGLIPDTRTSTGYPSNGIIIYNFEDGQLKKKNSFIITGTQNSIPGSATASFGAMAIARYNKEGYIVLVGTDQYLYAYKPNGERHWRSDKPCSTTTINIVNIADFNGDGIPEVYVGNKIFSLSNGKLLCDGGTSNNTGVMSTNTGSSPMAIDITRDGKLNLVAGTQIYDVTITNNNGTAGNSISVITDLELPASKVPANSYKDGMTQVVDIDNDGQLEVVVTTLVSGRVVTYIWKPQPDGQSILMGSYLAPSTSVSYNCIPMIGDIDNDGYPEIVFITNGTPNRMYALQYDPTASMGSRLKLKWQLAHTDNSGCTGMSLFDFNLDGTAEIVYRDEKTLRIINGNFDPVTVDKMLPDNQILQTFNNVTSATLREYPIIADIDNDGQAEIIIQGHDGGAAGGTTQNGYVRIFKSAGSQWAPARTVWNQYNYNSVNVNEDLTIPKQPFEITMKFNGKDKIAGTADDVRIFNNFRQQQTYLDKNGIAYMKIANAVIVEPEGIKYEYDAITDILTIKDLKVKNEGEATLISPFMITTFKNSIPSEKQYTYKYENDIAINQTATISFSISDFKSWMSVDKLIIKINDAGTGFNYQEVCDSCYVDNESLTFAKINLDKIAWADSYRKCVEGSVKFDTNNLPGEEVLYYWYVPNGLTPFSTEKTTTISSLQLTDAGEYLFKAEKIDGVLDITYKLPYLSVAPETMYWKQDAGDQNWNNINNWAYKINGEIKEILAIPAPCTNVHIPGIASHFPSLDTETTPIDIYEEPEVNNIIFHYGSALAYQHNLKYNKAFVQYNFGNYTTGNADMLSNYMQRDKWYPLAAPLKKMASGDFALAGYPFSWQANYQVEIQNGSPAIVQANAYSSNDVDLQETSYNAIAIKIAPNKSGIGYGDHRYLESLGGIIEIPYFENEEIAKYRPGHKYDKYTGSSSFYYYNTLTLQTINSSVGTMKRGDEAYRFVYENETTKQPNEITVDNIKVPGYEIKVKAADEANNMVLIGNPFLAPINTANFFEVNKNALAGSNYWIYNSLETWEAVNYSEGKSINSFQSFIVKLSSKEQTLLFPLEGDYALTGPVKPEPTMGEVPFKPLTVSLSDLQGNGEIAILASASDSDVSSNVEKLLSSSENAVPEVFFVDNSEGTYNLMQLYNNDIAEIGIGVKASQTGTKLTLNFQNVQEFVFNNDVRQLVLVDKVTGSTQDLTTASSYSFVHNGNPTDGQYVDTQRFALKLSETAIENSQNIQIYYKDNAIHVEGMDINYLQIYNVAGTKLYELGKGEINYIPLKQGVYIVKAYDKDGKQKAARIMVP